MLSSKGLANSNTFALARYRQNHQKLLELHIFETSGQEESFVAYNVAPCDEASECGRHCNGNQYTDTSLSDVPSFLPSLHSQ